MYFIVIQLITFIYMKQICKFVSGRDIVQTVPGLQVNISDSIDFHRIQDTSVPSMYNGQQDISEVGTRIREPFDVIEFDRTYTRIRHSVLKEKSEKESKADR